MFPVPEL